MPIRYYVNYRELPNSPMLVSLAFPSFLQAMIFAIDKIRAQHHYVQIVNVKDHEHNEIPIFTSQFH